MQNLRKFKAVKENVPGDFYVEDNCCTFCGVPHAEAPTLFGGIDEEGKVTHSQCYVKKQSTSSEELTQMIKVMVCQDLACIRYSVHDKTII